MRYAVAATVHAAHARQHACRANNRRSPTPISNAVLRAAATAAQDAHARRHARRTKSATLSVPISTALRWSAATATNEGQAQQSRVLRNTVYAVSIDWLSANRASAAMRIKCRARRSVGPFCLCTACSSRTRRFHTFRSTTASRHVQHKSTLSTSDARSCRREVEISPSTSWRDAVHRSGDRCLGCSSWSTAQWLTLPRNMPVSVSGLSGEAMLVASLSGRRLGSVLLIISHVVGT